ncbi:tubulin polyglutamylase TTLL1-like protein [Euroglyphus maynei]|uniref:Tubulin polyglutamylase TTLL1-like protein n=1 Tax=Euroglyphus maynei TaxID=6958 RepID=A0A1Y3BMX4_EURMA|nr:tubulin polyglutamylase TTLL1-like protein [Euroglyphus maynei]
MALKIFSLSFLPLRFLFRLYTQFSLERDPMMDGTNVMKLTTENATMIELNVSLKSSEIFDDVTTSFACKNGVIHNNQENGYNHHSNETIMNGGGDTNHSSSTSSSQSSPLDTKLIFFEMMAQIIRYQLQICDQQPNQSMDQTMTFSLHELSLSNHFPRLDDSKKRPYMLQPSMFPLMYPTVYFVAEDDILSDVPQEVKPFLRWKITSITANTMRSIVVRSGYKLMPVDRNPKNKTFNNWNAIWCKHLRVTEFQLIGYYQRVNHFPGSFNFGRKDRLWLNLKSKIDKYGADMFGNFHPPTFIMPNDYSSLVAYWNSDESMLRNHSNDEALSKNIIPKMFICKPPASARGQGIDIVTNLEELHALMSQQNCITNSNSNNINGSTSRKPKVSMVVQEYISNPCLLHNDAKFDLRVYVLITSILPLRVYVYDEGLVRFAANRYSNSVDDIKNQFIHLTNYSVNKNCVEYIPSSNVDSQDGHKWTLKTLWKHLSMTRKLDVDHIWQQIIDLIIKTVISAESNILTLLKQNLKNRRSCFELLGFDIILDENLKLWLLEVNITPSLRADSVLDFSVKNQLVRDILNTLGYQLSPRFRRHYNFGHLVCPEKNDLLTQMTVPDNDKHNDFEESFKSNGFDDAYSNQLTDQLNDDDVMHLMESEDELSRCGKFRRVFPASNSRSYLKYFDSCHYYNLLLTAWEERYHRRRQDGIDRLRSYMLAKDSVKSNVEKLKVQLNEINRNISILLQQQPLS